MTVSVAKINQLMEQCGGEYVDWLLFLGYLADSPDWSASGR